MSTSLTVQMQDLLNEYVREVDEAAKNAIKSVAKESAQMLRGTSPKGPNGYAGGWRTKKLSDKAIVVHNGKMPGLTHLLEHGHVSRNQFGTYGRVRAIPHIKPVEVWANAELQNRIMKELP